ncbi:MAG TPA: metal ABC transporter permease, partial [Acetivibrio saccincola]|nr:metal ABC transporter permease [Acetivibrio saccincola]
MIGYLLSIFQDYTLRTVLLGSGILGITSGILGTFTLLRKQSLLGDAVSHSALPGIAIAFLLTKSSSPVVLLSGALISGWVSS